ncbi:multiple sugar transport system ATP-binding protein [Breoghania corrubedonensis]|uniref:Multiple sugar transport system ATP-binding protein n=1 Tax=Breoghania corrubedonensis TaxID=665038 RepID=A0A2T5US58_9HYPH|nr:ABC transporter ATP-binding protein [Breoghania corrubedonensis]PTW54342.1 multiple sugar transport system ATP-binding protein [Breoghania corrubedonensis]
MATVTLRDICKSYGKSETVTNVNLTVEDREFMVLVGPSGCGKSTTLRMIAGLEEITSGQLLIDGVDVTDLPPQRRDIAMVFQSYALYPHMTAYHNMAFGLLKTSKLTKTQVDARIREAAEILNITDLLGRRPKELSGGERQRVAIGRALVRQPKVFLFDEPLSNLDAKLRNHMRGELKRLHRDLGLSIIYVTHDQIEAMTLGTRVAMMSKGRLQQVDRPMDIYLNPANTFVAGFIGSPEMALIACRSDQRGTIRHNAFRSAVELKADNLPNDVLFGVRPEEVSFSRTAGMAQGKVEQSELIGAEALVQVRLGDELMMVRCQVSDAPQPGSDVGLDFDLSRARLFHAGTGQAINLVRE